MTWMKVDDSLAFHAKAVQAGNAAMGMWVRAGSWCAQQLTGGVVPGHMVNPLGNRSQATALVVAGLWTQIDGDYLFHDWDDYQPSAEDIRADRATKHEAKVTAGRAGGLASGRARGSKLEADAKQNGSKKQTDGEANGKRTGSETKPRPGPSLQSKAPPGGTAGAEPDGSTVVMAYVNGAVGAGKLRPTEKLRAKVGQRAKALASEGVAWPDLIVAASRMGASGWDDLDRELQNPQRGKPVGDGRASLPDADYDDLGVFARSQP